MASTPTNPYSTPAANLYGSTSGGSSDLVGPGTLAMLATSKPWVRFLSVMAWLGIILTLVFAAFCAYLSTQPMPSQDEGRVVFEISAGLYGIIALIYISPAVKLWQFATSIGFLAATRSVVDLDKTLNQLRGFWKVVGIMIIITVCLILVAFFGLIGLAAVKSGAIHR